ncbi:oligosaccharide flippase family protein [Paraglaciecola chathamensis]|uniref:oligosaccharide flippase family protein n=1 Tax=Paraglaciecola chathamensis TaxID=368405 RepID=UPI002703D9DD|nr:oligosaccharide flippase family protein [Paraglaciecola chathamensis]MDO6838892.1 oligosaccharide flippase family protein [Paraglaciecola chathamensis]
MSNTSNKIINSASLLIAGKFFQRAIGLVSIVILARVLSPKDFAVAAIISMVIYFFDVLSNLGNEQYIIQKKGISDEDINTAWTINIIIKVALAFILLAFVPLIDSYYPEIQLTAALFLATLVLPIRAISNSGLLLFERNLQYKQIFFLTVFQRVISFTTVMLVIWVAPSFWALILGDVAAALSFSLGSYVVHTFRPVFSLKNIKEQWIFSRWLLAKNIVGYGRSQIDTFIVSSLFNARDLGRYYLARDIVMIPSQNILTPALQPLLATFSQQHHNDSTSLSRQINLALAITTLLTIPIVFYIWFFPSALIDTILGSQWKDSYKLLSHLSLLVLYIPFILLFEHLMVAKGWVKQVFIFDLSSLLFITLGLLFFGNETLSDFALLRGALGVLATLMLIIYLRTRLDFSCRSWGFWCVSSVFFAYFSVYLTQRLMLSFESMPVIELVISGSFFIILYASLNIIFMLKLAPKNDQCLFITTLISRYSKILKSKVLSTFHEIFSS